MRDRPQPPLLGPSCRSTGSVQQRCGVPLDLGRETTIRSPMRPCLLGRHVRASGRWWLVDRVGEAQAGHRRLPRLDDVEIVSGLSLYLMGGCGQLTGAGRCQPNRTSDGTGPASVS